MEITLNKSQLITGAAAVVITAVVTYGVALMGAGAKAADREHIEAVVKAMLMTTNGSTYGAALSDNTAAISTMALQLEADKVAFAEFRREYREDQRILQAALRELASDP